MMMRSSETISVIGLGKLGAPLSALLAARGFRVIGIDCDPDVVEAINCGCAPVSEPHLQDYMNRGRERLTATSDYDEAILSSEVSFVVVPTPSDDSGGFSNRFVCDAVEKIGQSLSRKTGYHVVNITSTVMPGSCDGVIEPTLASASGRTIGKDVGLCYNPEFIALGSVLQDMRRPDFVLVGEYDSRAGDQIEQVHRSICENDAPIQRMSLINAEISKIAINTFLTTKISYANMLAEICERMPGADADVVSSAVGSDSRIGRKYLRGALGYGGPCFPRDNLAFIRMAEKLGVYSGLAQATDTTNRHQVDRILERVISRTPSAGTVGILGMTYKPDTTVIEGSQSVELAKRLLERGYSVCIYDPVAADKAAIALGPSVMVAETMGGCALTSDFLIIATMWPQFRDLPVDSLRRPLQKVDVLDCWRLLSPQIYRDVANLIYLGNGPDKSLDGSPLDPEAECRTQKSSSGQKTLIR